MEKRKEKLGGYLKVSYGLADLGFIFMVTMSNTYRSEEHTSELQSR